MNKKCQVFTPSDYVIKLLDCVEYKKNIYGKKVLENSCGDGNILVEVVRRYIEDCRAKNISANIIKKGLERDIYGFEIDPEHFQKCITNLDSIAQKLGFIDVKWNIKNCDYLTYKDFQLFDYIIGNPPYITYSELTTSQQNYLKKNFESCKRGKFDYYYAFLEKSIDSLSLEGKMSYLIPSSVFKTVFGEDIREKMRPVVTQIIDYSQEKLFKEAIVKSSIIIIDKKGIGNNIKYYDITTGVKREKPRKSFGKKWNFYFESYGEKRFGDYFKVSHVVATLCNQAFVIKKWNEDENGNFICDEYVLESRIVRDGVTPRNKYLKKREKIIFPYDYSVDNKLIRFGEVEFKKNFPGVYEYLLEFKKELDKRDKDKSANWYEYGRSQALSGLNCEKVLISTIISSDVQVYKLNKKSIPYAGMYIIPITEEYNLDDCVEILKNKKFLDYVRNIGIPINGNSVRITSKDIEEYRF